MEKRFFDYFKGYEEIEILKIITSLDKDKKKKLYSIYNEDWELSNLSNLDRKPSDLDVSYTITRIKNMLNMQRETIVKKDLKEESIEKISKEEFAKIYELLKLDSFQNLITTYGIRDSLVIILKFGYINNKSFESKTIADFLEMPLLEVDEIYNKILSSYNDISKQKVKD